MNHTPGIGVRQALTESLWIVLGFNALERENGEVCCHLTLFERDEGATCQRKNYQIVFYASTWRNAQVHSGESSIGTNGLPKADSELEQNI
jgi:hypothetical protein